MRVVNFLIKHRWTIGWVFLGVSIIAANEAYQNYKENEIESNPAYTYGKVEFVSYDNGIRIAKYAFTVAGKQYFGIGGTDSRFYDCANTHKCDGMIIKIKYSKRNPDISNIVHEP